MNYASLTTEELYVEVFLAPPLEESLMAAVVKDWKALLRANQQLQEEVEELQDNVWEREPDESPEFEIAASVSHVR